MYKTLEALEKLVPESHVIDIAFTILFETDHEFVDLVAIDRELAEALDRAEPADISTLI